MTDNDKDFWSLWVNIYNYMDNYYTFIISSFQELENIGQLSYHPGFARFKWFYIKSIWAWGIGLRGSNGPLRVHARHSTFVHHHRAVVITTTTSAATTTAALRPTRLRGPVERPGAATKSLIYKIWCIFSNKIRTWVVKQNQYWNTHYFVLHILQVLNVYCYILNLNNS